MTRLFKVLLISPYYEFTRVFTTMKEVHSAMERKPPLGLLSVATYLKRETDLEVRVLDNQLESLGEMQLADLLRDYEPDVVGVSVVSFKLYEAFMVSRVVKESCPDAHVCWGGPHLSIYPRESLSLNCVDSIILGDGEIPFARLCLALSQSKGITDIEGVYTLHNVSSHSEFKAYWHDDLDSLPLPDLTLLPYKSYRAFLSNNQMATAVTARGCPFRCIFCRLDHSKLRLLSLDKVLTLTERYLELGVREIEFYDETFNFSVGRVKTFAEEILKRGLKFNWSFRGRIDQVDSEMLRLAKAAGCQRIQYGVEAGTDRVLKLLRKRTTVAKIRRCFELTNTVGIDTVAYLILGSPGETMEEMNQTVKLIREIRPSYVEYTLFNISPGTTAYQMALEQGVIDQDYWGEYAARPRSDIPILMWTKDYSREELEAMRQRALKDFYLRPAYILDRFLRLRPKDAVRTFRTGYGLLRSLW